MRITGGRARGITLHTPAKGAAGLRPATDKLREALFNHLGHLGCFDGERPLHGLDLFAGTGAYGLEALSRATHPLSSLKFVELNPRHCQLIQQHVATVCKSAGHDPQHCHVYQANACGPLGMLPLGQFDLIWADPPYSLYETSRPQPRPVRKGQLRPSTHQAAQALWDAATHSDEGLSLPSLPSPRASGQSPLQALWARLAQWLRPGPMARVILEHPVACPAPKLPGLCPLHTLGATQGHKATISRRAASLATAPASYEPCLTLYGWAQEQENAHNP